MSTPWPGWWTCARTRTTTAPERKNKARDKKAIELFGEYVWLNFPPEAT